MDQVSDACWEESRKCPKVCKDEYFSRRMAGMDSLESDPLFLGRRREDNSCVPGVDELTHPLGKVTANDSDVRVTVMVGGLPAVAEVDASDRKSVVSGKGLSLRFDHSGHRHLKPKTKINHDTIR